MSPVRAPDATPQSPPRRNALRRAGRGALAVLGAALPWPSNALPEPRRVLIVHSFGRDFAPYDAVIGTFRRELASRSPEPVGFFEASLDAGRPIGPGEEATFVAYLAARFADPAPDLIVGSAGPAAQFLVRYRDTLFPGKPLLLTAIDARLAPLAKLAPGDALVATKLDMPRAFEALLQILPGTRQIAIVLGDTPLERFWRKELQRDLAGIASRVNLVWLDGLSLAALKQRVAALPPDSAVFYGLMVADAAGVPHERLEALAELKRVADAPIFSLFETELGRGVVGGPYLSQTRVGEVAAAIALRQLATPPLDALETVTIGMETVAYDWRELQRWRVDEARVPPGSEVRHRTPPVWVEHRNEIVAAITVILAQAGLIAALLLQRARRRRAEQAAHTLSGRLITAHEDEGRRLARELHDDVTQRLAGVSIEAATLARLTEPAARSAAEQSIRTELAQLSRDVHALSYRLHPSVVDDLGLEEALRIECAAQVRRQSVAIDFEAGTGADAATVGGESALCLFRVAQEALRNSLCHARATRIGVQLRQARGGTELSVVDDGQGFDPTAARERASLGLASMRERVSLLGGRLHIDSAPGRGTRVTAWIPATAAP